MEAMDLDTFTTLGILIYFLFVVIHMVMAGNATTRQAYARGIVGAFVWPAMLIYWGWIHRTEEDKTVALLEHDLVVAKLENRALENKIKTLEAGTDYR